MPGAAVRVDLNADVGEVPGLDLPSLFQSITSANIACGVHAGDPAAMRACVRAAAARGVAVGAHPGFWDREGFGRREGAADPGETGALVLYQLGALGAIARAEGVALRHVKPHGAMYNMSTIDAGLADAIAGAIAVYDPTLILLGLPGSELLAAGRRRGLRVAAEGFADCTYQPDGRLVPRAAAGALIVDPRAAAEQGVRLARDGLVVARGGALVSAPVETICVHGDTPGAAAIAAALREALERAGVAVRAPGCSGG